MYEVPKPSGLALQVWILQAKNIRVLLIPVVFSLAELHTRDTMENQPANLRPLTVLRYCSLSLQDAACMHHDIPVPSRVKQPSIKL